jgi:tetratricopeptide (TPR) repeat protein
MCGGTGIVFDPRAESARLWAIDEDTMNLLLYMLGRASHATPAVRPTARQLLHARAARAAARGDLAAALEAYRTLADSPVATTLDVLICGHLHLLQGEGLEARLCFAEGVTRLYQPGVDDAATSLEHLLGEADAQLSAGQPEQAEATIRRARTLLEVLLVAEAGMVLASGSSIEDSPLAVLAGLGNLTLRLLARARLAGPLASSLRRRSLRTNGALRATSDNLKSLLANEENRLIELANRFPDHAEIHYRLGVVASAAADSGQAVAAFRTVLALHPYHVSSAVRLSAAEPVAGLPILARAFAMPAGTVQLFAALAEASQDERRLERVMNRFCAAHHGMNPAAARGNIAFALSELAVLTEAQEAWREPVTL